MSATRRIDLVRAVAAVVMMLAAVPSLAQDAETVWVDLPSAGRLAPLAELLPGMLESRGLQVVEAAARRLPEPLPSRVVTDGDSIRDPQRQQVLRQFIEEGGGLVLIIGRSRRHIEQANRFVNPFGIEIISASISLDPVEFYATPLASDLDMPDVGSLRMAITGQVAVPLARQGGHLVCAAATFGEGGIIIVPDALALAGINGDPHAPGPQLLVRCVAWSHQLSVLASLAPAAQSTVPSEAEPAVPAGGTHLRTESRDFAGAILYDCQSTEDEWQKMSAVVVRVLKETGLPVKALKVAERSEPLVAALPSWPKLLVLGTWRQYSVAEQAAIYQYVAAGGALLALAHVHTDQQIRLVYLNEVLDRFGVLCSLGRPGAEAQATAGPVQRLGDIPGGVRFIGRDLQPLITVGSRPHFAAGRQQFESGRLVVMDARPLLTNAAYRLQLARHILPWLLPSD